MTEKRFTVCTFPKGSFENVLEDNLTGDAFQFTYEYHRSICELLNKLNDENEQLKSFKQRVFDLIDKTIEEETQIAENIEEVAQETRPYAKAVNRLTINTLENLKWELQRND